MLNRMKEFALIDFLNKKAKIEAIIETNYCSFIPDSEDCSL